MAIFSTALLIIFIFIIGGLIKGMYLNNQSLRNAQLTLYDSFRHLHQYIWDIWHCSGHLPLSRLLLNCLDSTDNGIPCRSAKLQHSSQWHGCQYILRKWCRVCDQALGSLATTLTLWQASGNIRLPICSCSYRLENIHDQRSMGYPRTSLCDVLLG